MDENAMINKIYRYFKVLQNLLKLLAVFKVFSVKREFKNYGYHNLFGWWWWYLLNCFEFYKGVSD